MIYDKISNAKLYAGISAAMAVAMEVLETTDFAAVAPGSYQVREGVYYNGTYAAPRRRRQLGMPSQVC